MRRRSAEKAGSWYPSQSSVLRDELKSYLSEAAVSEKPDLCGTPRGVIVPHAGLSFSGPTAACAYRWLSEKAQDTTTFILFGAVHTMNIPVPCVWTRGAWQTPLGDLAVDEDLADELVRAGVGIDQPAPHLGDNAIELQTPFLAYLFPQAKIVPIAVPPIADAVQLGASVWQVVQEFSKAQAEAGEKARQTVAIGSTDLTHYGQAYGFAPAGSGAGALEWAKENDERLLELIVKMDAASVIPTARKDRSACGAGAVAATVSFARAAGCRKGVVLDYSSSFDRHPEPNPQLFVGYAAVGFAGSGQ